MEQHNTATSEAFLDGAMHAEIPAQVSFAMNKFRESNNINDSVFNAWPVQRLVWQEYLMDLNDLRNRFRLTLLGGSRTMSKTKYPHHNATPYLNVSKLKWHDYAWKARNERNYTYKNLQTPTNLDPNLNQPPSKTSDGSIPN